MPARGAKKLSVIIPLYNVKAYVSKAADSIASQTFDGLEVVVVDDGSTDGSLEACVNYLPKVDVVSIQQENAGLSAARNEGIYAASGEYIMFLDADDFLLPGAFENINAALEANGPDVLFGRYLRWSPEKGLLEGKPCSYRPPDDPKRRTEYILSALPEPPWNAWRYVCRRHLSWNADYFSSAAYYARIFPGRWRCWKARRLFLFCRSLFTRILAGVPVRL